MKSATNRLIITIVATILLPLVIYSVYEISTVKEGEEVIEKVYRDQLDAILFSVNQYSDDVVNGLLNKLQNQMQGEMKVDSIAPYLKYSNFEAIILQNHTTQEQFVIAIGSELPNADWIQVQDTLFANNPHLVDQLIRYMEGGYRKIEPGERFAVAGINFRAFHTVLENPGTNQLILLTGILNRDGFTENALGPKLQQIADEDLIITVGEVGSENYVYTTDSLKKEVMFREPMWIFPEMEIGISSNTKTVKELVDERTQYNLLAAFMLILLLVFGFSLVVRNLRREMQLAQTKSDFVSNVSHELRTPLSLISMFAETLLLDRVPSKEKRKEYEEIIFKETSRLTNIVNKILNFSQIEANKRTYHPVEMNLNDLIEELIHDYSFHLDRNGFTYEVELEKNLPILKLDREGMYEALVNLVDNGMKYSPDTKHLIFRTGFDNRRVYLEVVDQGIGIAPDQVKQIFDKFYRISEGNVHTTRGAGLGLALVSHIVDSHGGDIEVESNVGKGSIFRLVFYLERDGENPDS